MIKKIKTKKEEGFVILFAVMVSSIILAITLGVADIAFKEIKFSTSVKDTNEAFFAADVGAECALFNDRSTSNSFLETGGSGVVQCLGFTIGLNGSFPVWNFVVPGLGSGGQGCARVTVDKSIDPNTHVISKGYNNGGFPCIQGQNTVERQLELNY